MSKKIFFLADDDSDDREMFIEALEGIDQSIVCHTAIDGRDLLNKLDTLHEKPHLIFLDVNMPIMTGWECLKALKEEPRFKDIPVIITSTSSHKREMDIAGDLGALCYFTKPNDFNDLKNVLKVIVQNLDAQLQIALKQMQGNGSSFVYVSAK